MSEEQRRALGARNQAVEADPAARRLANARGVELTQVTGTGEGGAITKRDVQVRIDALRPKPPVEPGVSARYGAGRFAEPRAEAVSTWAQGAAGAQRVQASRSRAPEPTLFGTGHLPPFTSSGIPPEALAQVPWQARHALASAPSPQEAYRILDEFTGLAPADAETLADVAYGEHHGNREYAQRVESWLTNGLSDEQVYAEMYGSPSQPYDEATYQAAAAQMGIDGTASRRSGGTR